MSGWLGFFGFVVLLMGGMGLGACGAGQPAVEPERRLQLVNVAHEIGLDFQHGAFRWGMSGDPVAMMGGGLCWLDYDNDGWLDLYVVNSYAVQEAGQWEREAGGLPTSVLYKNEGGRFVDVSAETNTNLALRGNGCVGADLNLDGYSDIYITTARFNMLLWNNGDGTFSEGGEAAGINSYGWQSAAVVGDMNEDTLPDLFVAGYVDINNQIVSSTMGFPNTHFGRNDLLYINEGLDADGKATFRAVHDAVGLIDSDPDAGYEYGLGAALTDVDRDGDLDLFVANDTHPNRLYLNEPLADDPLGIGFRMREQGDETNIDDTDSGMGVASGDFDGDGLNDILVTNMGPQLHSVYRNDMTTSGRFLNATGDLGVRSIGYGYTGWGTSWADFDNDSDLDLFVANGEIPLVDLEDDALQAQLFINETAQGETGKLVDSTGASGVAAVGPLNGRGSAVADYDNDGDLDVAVVSVGQPLVLLENRGETGNWLRLTLEPAVPGTIIMALLPDGRTLHRETQAGSSYLASEDPRVHLGLGLAKRVRTLEVRWPDGTTRTIRDIKANREIVVTP